MDEVVERERRRKERADAQNDIFDTSAGVPVIREEKWDTL